MYPYMAVELGKRLHQAKSGLLVVAQDVTGHRAAVSSCTQVARALLRLGVAHPPGHPLPSLLGRACTLVPVGSIAFKVGLASALASAGAAAQTARLGRLVARRARRTAQSDARIDGLVTQGEVLVSAVSGPPRASARICWYISNWCAEPG